MSHRGIAAAFVAAAIVALTTTGQLVSAQAGGTYLVDMTIPLEAGAPWAIGDIWHFPWSEEVDDEPRLDEADARLLFRDDAGAVLYSRLVARSVLCNGECHEVDWARTEIPAQPAARRAQLYTIDSLGNPVDLRAERVRSPNAPVVEILSPRPGQVLTDGLVIQWRGIDADDDPLTYDVLYRPSVGDIQQEPLVILTTETSTVFTREGLPADDNATIAIVANDGFNTTEATVSGLKLEGNLPPEVVIYAPRDGMSYLEGVGITLMALANDPEDGELPVSWVSSLDGPLTLVDDEWTSASVGVHLLTASASDSEGVTASEQITVRIEAEPTLVLFLPVAVRSANVGG